MCFNFIPLNLKLRFSIQVPMNKNKKPRSLAIQPQLYVDSSKINAFPTICRLVQTSLSHNTHSNIYIFANRITREMRKLHQAHVVRFFFLYLSQSSRFKLQSRLREAAFLAYKCLALILLFFLRHLDNAMDTRT